MANTLALFRNGAVGFIDWLDPAFELTGGAADWAEVEVSVWILVSVSVSVLAVASARKRKCS